jgi:hypothetical protein
MAAANGSYFPAPLGEAAAAAGAAALLGEAGSVAIASWAPPLLGEAAAVAVAFKLEGEAAAVGSCGGGGGGASSKEQSADDLASTDALGCTLKKWSLSSRLWAEGHKGVKGTKDDPGRQLGVVTRSAPAVIGPGPGRGRLKQF